jgi:shikimate dehydrogenase
LTHPFRLGLVGAQIKWSMAPRFHIAVARRLGIELDYVLLEQDSTPRPDVPAVVARLRRQGYGGINITYPFKEAAIDIADHVEPGVRALGALNTLVFDDAGVRGFNTDHSGLLRLWAQRGGWEPGTVAVVGAGGVGRAAAFALAALGADELRIFDRERDRSEHLAMALRAAHPTIPVRIFESSDRAIVGAQGVFNGTPVGMHFMPGSAVDLALIRDQAWVFDAIYAPLRTPLVTRALEQQITTFTGFDLFISQATDAFGHFTGVEPARALVDEVEAELLPIAETLC